MSHLDIGGLRSLDLSQPNKVTINWQDWRDQFHLFLQANEITDPIRQKIQLLHQGGKDLLKIYKNLPASSTPVSADKNVFQIAIDQLNAYFISKRSLSYERMVFRNICQNDLKVEEFLLKLRTQAALCELKGETLECYMIDQIIEKCNSKKLRKRLLEKDMTLDEVIQTAKAFELTNEQVKEHPEFSTSMEAVKEEKIHEIRQKSKQMIVTCYNCGKTGHYSSSEDCPARGRSCKHCNKKGHFSIVCRSKKHKQVDPPKPIVHVKKERYEKPTKQKSIKTISVGEASESEEEYCFHLEDDTQDSDIIIEIGGVNINVVIDSGASCNVVDDKTWSFLKSRKIKVIDSEAGSSKVIRAYAHATPLVVLGSFRAAVYAGGKSKEAKFYVIENGKRSLLGRKTAIELGVLKLGFEVNMVNEKQPFPKMRGIQIEIPVDSNVRPISQPYRRVPIPLMKLIDKKLNDLENLDIIERVDAPSKWVSPIVPDLKNNSEVRICLDMRMVNKAVTRIKHPLPTMDQLLPELNKCALFSRLDITNAFHQLELHPNSRSLTTFITHRGLYRYKRLVFGISCAPEIFQKTMEQILCGCEGVFNFIDDIIIFAPDKVLDVLKNNDILLNKQKCLFLVSQLEFLGNLLTEAGIKPSPEKVAAIKKFRAPESLEELRSFLGLVTFHSKFIPDFSTMTELLWEIVRSKVFTWNSSHQKCFEALKNQLSNETKLGYYDPNDKTRVIADASPVGLGAVLVQFKGDVPRIIYFASKSLTATERRYCQTEREALALVWAVERFRVFLYGKQFQLVTDHKALLSIFRPQSRPCPRIERWVLRLQTFTFEIVYCEGKKNIADPFSRLYQEDLFAKPFDVAMDECVNSLTELTAPMAVPLETISEHSERDSIIQGIKAGIYDEDWNEEVMKYKVFHTEFCFSGEILLRGTKIVVPQSLQKNIMELAHEGHPGIMKMKQRLRQKVWWYKLDSAVEKYVKNCRGCIFVSAPNNPLPMVRRELPSEPIAHLAIDFLGPLPSEHYLLVVIDYYSRYQEIFVMTRITAKETVFNMRDWISRLGVPLTITADNGPTFISKEFGDFCKEYGITLNHTIPYWPAMNGEVERQNSSVLKRLKISQNLKRDWRKDLHDYLLMYHTTAHSTTGKSPHEMLFHKTGRDKLPMISQYEMEDGEARDNDRINREKGKQYSDKKRRAGESEIAAGDKVLVQNFQRTNKLSANFLPTTHTVVKINKGDTTVRNDETGKEFRRYVGLLKPVGSGIEDTIETGNSKEEEPKDVTNEKEEAPVAKRIRKAPKKLEDYIRKIL